MLTILYPLHRGVASNFPLERTAGSPSLAAAAQRYVRPTDEEGPVLRRIRHLGALAVALVLSSGTASLAEAQQPTTSPRVGVLVPQPRGWEEKAFRQTLSGLGYSEGVNVILDVRSAEGQLARLPSLASELVRSGPHVIVAVNTPGTRAAIAATKTIPIVMVAVGDPVATGFVTNLARPEGNVTGVSNLCGELAAKRLSLLKEAVPTARRIAVMLNPDDPITNPQMKDAERAAPSIGVEVRSFPARTATFIW